MTTSCYRHAAEVEEIAGKLIAEHHTDLAGQTIRYVFREKATTSRGAAVLGKARKISGLNAALVSLVGRDEVDDPAQFFVIEIAEDAWSALNKDQRVALVDHELCHFATDEDSEGNQRLILRPHDLEEFTQVVDRHGLWRPPVEAFAAVVKAAAGQLSIDDAAED